MSKNAPRRGFESEDDKEDEFDGNDEFIFPMKTYNWKTVYKNSKTMRRI